MGLLEETRVVERRKLMELVDFRGDWSKKLEDFHPREAQALQIGGKKVGAKQLGKKKKKKTEEEELGKEKSE